MLLAVIVFILLLIIFFLILKSDQLNNNSTQQAGYSYPAVVEKVEFAELEKLIEQWQILDRQAKQQDFARWAAKDIEHAESEADSGEINFRKKEFTLAKKNYVNAIKIIEDIKLSKSTVLKNLLDQADSDLQTGDWENAKQLYAKSLLIDKKNQRGLDGLKQSETLKTIIDLYTNAEDLLIQPDEKSIQVYNEVIQLLDKAMRLNQTFSPVTELKSEIENKRNRLIFQQHISSSMKNLQENKFIAARQFLLKAQNLDAENSTVKELKNRINREEENYRITALKQSVDRKEKHEQWSAVIDVYNKILAIEPNAIFAIQGKRNAMRVNEWHNQLDRIIGNPEKLQSDHIRENTIRRISFIKEYTVNNPEHKILRNKLSEASELIAISAIEISMHLISDNETNIEVYKIGKLGQFKDKTLRVKPGKYTIVGTRPGYRDVRLNIQIHAKDTNPYFSVICRDLI